MQHLSDSFKPKFDGFEGAEDFSKVVTAGGFDSVFNIANEARVEDSCRGLDEKTWAYVEKIEEL